MGLSSKQVISSDGLDWSSQTLLQAQTLELPKPPNNLARKQQNQQQLEPLKCPRCDSTNTKFCYYNNYSKSQPRHFCKACKRHWTKGGTLRNVPLGGGRKNKRQKTSSKAATTNNKTSTVAATTPTSNNTRNTINRVNPQWGIQAQHLGIGGDQKNMSNILHQAFIRQPSSAIQHDSINLDNTSNNINDVFLGSSLSLPHSQSLNFPYPISSSIDTNPCAMYPTSFDSSIAYNYSTGEAMEDSIITTIMPSTNSSITHTWQVANTVNNGMEYWNWDDIENFTSTDLNIPWDDPDQIKP